jgi:EAL domain-containing protein (putative c-di-GMP-specific phosphodiesterase class I)
VAAVIQLAHALGLQVVAEGVETEQQLDILRNMHCDYAQGFLFSRPVPADELRSRFGQRLDI